LDEKWKRYRGNKPKVS